LPGWLIENLPCGSIYSVILLLDAAAIQFFKDVAFGLKEFKYRQDAVVVEDKGAVRFNPAEVKLDGVVIVVFNCPLTICGTIIMVTKIGTAAIIILSPLSLQHGLRSVRI